MNAGDSRWGAPRIQGELLQLGFNVSEPAVSRYLHRLKRRRDEGKAKRWLTFLKNHRELIVVFDFFTVPTAPQLQSGERRSKLRIDSS